ncbi:Gfo/Idh/MocA family oxidoreductase [Sphingomonas sp. BT-65]|uniref:Gfo/Idh/MocA family protein n=1 Tax=Sphingomonas sp. BT-65 TaxID=2989821 RepID=UPI00223554D6|nr:Gfo/Idh/MocA family oxidoreductase [Sphingomonas sp. BT-65]MCW4462004.1 Gfo/Idh/MocA family oxidoreductase [Sphingomonas sp. BT-65]
MDDIPIPIAVVGIGKIARDQHLPAIAASPAFELAAVVSAHADDLDVPALRTIEALAAALPEVRAVAICTPPIGRHALIAAAFRAGLHVLIEKPPAATLAEAEGFAALAAAAGRGFYATWHAREAPAVAPARAWLADKQVRRTEIRWLEDVRVWHPGQQWIWKPGIGVFDPGINAFSIATHILPGPLAVQEAALHFPENRDAPIAAELALADGHGAPVDVQFSFDQQGPQRWDIRVETDRGMLDLVEGGNRLLIDGAPVPVPHLPEYHRIYARFADIVADGRIDADLAPFRLVADAFLLGTRRTAAPFFDQIEEKNTKRMAI